MPKPKRMRGAKATPRIDYQIRRGRFNMSYRGGQRLFGFREVSRWAGGGSTSWRDHFRIHPVADVFPLLSPDELRKLAADI